MGGKKTRKELATLVAVALLTTSTLATVAVVVANNAAREAAQPKIYFEGVSLRPVAMGEGATTLQALVDVYIENVPLSAGVVFKLKCDSSYWQPSSFDGNEIYSKTEETDTFYHISDDLYGGVSPFWNYNSEKNLSSNHIDLGSTASGDTAYTLSVCLTPRTFYESEKDNWPVKGKIKYIENVESSGGEEEEEGEESGTGETLYNLYIDATEKTKIVTLSFRLEQDHLADMVAFFNGKSSENGIVDGIVDGIEVEKSLLEFATDGVPILPNWGDAETPKLYMTPAETLFSWNVPERPVDVTATEKTVAVSAYQAYTNGTVADLAATLQKYCPTVRATYSSGKQEDLLFYWGEGDGFEIKKADGDIRRFSWMTDATGAYNGGYNFEKKDGDTWVAADDETTWYSCLGCDYKISRYIDYEDENGNTQQYELPVVVDLIVTPVVVTGAHATDETKIYKQTEAEAFTYDDLSLPREAQLSTNVVSGAGSLTVDIVDWNPGYTADMKEISGEYHASDDATKSVAWNEVGDYTFKACWDGNGTETLTAGAIQAKYPWLTVDADYTLDALRRIIANDDETITDAAQYDFFEGQTVGESGNLVLRIAKRGEDGGYMDMPEGTTFRLKLPDGTIVDKTWFVTNGGVTYYSSIVGNFEYTAGSGTITVGEIRASFSTDTAGDDDDARKDRAYRELLHRYANLGGYFQIAVTELGKEESEFIARYVPPRENAYTKSYVDNDAFDFTGLRAGLLPFYKDQPKLPTTVVLPYGSEYSVATRYDGVTGAENGALHVVKVGNWTTVQPTGGDWNDATSLWEQEAIDSTDPITVQHGPDSMLTAYFDGFGSVVNANKNQATILTQVREEPAPEKQDCLRLTYEGSGAAVSSTADGEVDTVTFEAQRVGYLYPQTVTLTLTNEGDTDVRGIYFDTSALNDAFFVYGAPATELPAGASTTFTLTYQPKLSAGVYDTAGAPATPLAIHSTNATTKTFNAYLLVTEKDLWQVKVESNDDTMGSGKLVVGVVDNTLDTDPGVSTHIAGDVVWVLAEPTGEFVVDRAYYIDRATGEEVVLYADPAVTEGEQVLYSFNMPAQNVTVYIDFKEPLRSKLRLEQLKVNGGENDDSLRWRLPLYRANDYAIVQDKDRTPDQPDLSAPDYLVLIPATDERAQLQLKLRDILLGAAAAEGIEAIPPIFPEVKITLNYGGGDVPVYSYARTTESQPVLDHQVNFPAPEAGETATATIVITAAETVDGTTENVTRTYTVKIARRPASPDDVDYPLQPGNSPYGMIEGDKDIVDKDAAKAAFDAGNRFVADSVQTPVKAARLINIYWPEAWGEGTNYDKDPNALFIYIGESFDDPGPASVRNTAGDVVAGKDITRTVEVDLLAEGSTQKEQFEGTTKATLSLGTVDSVNVQNWWIDGETTYAVRPGVYTLTYHFTDVDGEELTFTRPLIILSRNGDVDMSGGVDSADASLITGRSFAPLGHDATGYSDSALFLYRVCDANNDRNLNNIDANTIRANGAIPYYLPEDYSNLISATDTP